MGRERAALARGAGRVLWEHERDDLDEQVALDALLRRLALELEREAIELAARRRRDG